MTDDARTYIDIALGLIGGVGSIFGTIASWIVNREVRRVDSLTEEFVRFKEDIQKNHAPRQEIDKLIDRVVDEMRSQFGKLELIIQDKQDKNSETNRFYLERLRALEERFARQPPRETE